MSFRTVASRRSPGRWAAGLLLAALVAAAAPPRSSHLQHGAPRALADTAFASVVARLSEPGAYFDTDNLISNESSYLHVVGGLRDLGVRGGAYLGVGPDQNFSYIAHIRPRLAILVDIRRDNLLQHLLFKALFDLSADRLQYLGLLLGRPVPARRDATQPLDEMVAYLDRTPMRPATLDSAHARVRGRLRAYGVPLSAQDLETIHRFHSTFAREGLALRFQSHGRPPQAYYPTLRQLVLERDRQGRPSSYLANDADFQFVRGLQRQNRVIPAVGDLAGDRALPAIARFLGERGERVSAYYTSNVEFYLAQEGKLDAFVANVKRLPRDPRGVVIRSVFRVGHPQSVPGYRSTQLLQPLDALVREHDAGRIRSYWDLVTIGAVDLR